MTTKAKPARTRDDYHTSKPPIPDNLVPMIEWADKNKITRICVQRWIYAGKLNAYRIPGYGTKNFIKPTEAAACLKPRQLGPSLAR